MSAVIFTNHSTQAFVYRWTNSQTGQWYIGSRTAQGCHPQDGYICSSRRLLPLIESNHTEWAREILCIGEPQDMLDLETRLLQQLDAKNDPLSLNQHNGDGRFTTTGVPAYNKGIKKPRGTPSWNSGKPNPHHSEIMKGRPAHNKGKPMSEEQKLKISLARKGKPSPKKGKPGVPSTPESNAKRSAKLKGRVSPMKGRTYTMSKETKRKISEALTGKTKGP
jgi:hypothetical protein